MYMYVGNKHTYFCHVAEPKTPGTIKFNTRAPSGIKKFNIKTTRIFDLRARVDKNVLYVCVCM